MTPTESDAAVPSTNALSNELLQQLPFIIASGRREGKRILRARPCAALETREWVLPAKDGPILNWIREDSRRRRINDGIDVQPNRLIHGDDLQVMSALITEQTAMPSSDERIDLICFDMPFSLPDGIRANAVHHPDQSTRCIATYLTMLVPRLFLMQQLLSDHGLVCMRVSSLARQYVKLIINDLFGDEDSGDRRLIEWAFDESITAPSEPGKSQGAVFLFGYGNVNRIERDVFQKLDEKIVNSNGPSEGYAASFQQRRCDGRWPEGMPQQCLGKTSSIATEGAPLQGVGGMQDSVEQPMFALEAVIQTATQAESIIADFSGDSGDTAALAERLGRRWITSDMDKSDCSNIRRRLIEQGAEPFLYQAIANPSESADRFLAGSSFRAGDLMQTVLMLYGAVPLLSEDDPDRNLGQMLNAGNKTLVLVDSPGDLTGLPTLRNALFHCDTLMGGWDKVVVLGWKFGTSLDATLASLNDSRLEVRAIPNDLLDTLKTKNTGGDFKDPVRFAKMSA